MREQIERIARAYDRRVEPPFEDDTFDIAMAIGVMEYRTLAASGTATNATASGGGGASRSPRTCAGSSGRN